MTSPTPDGAAADRPLVTIVTPSFNKGSFIEDGLRSVAGQSYPRIEHVVIDGGSTDRTLELLRRYESIYTLRWRSEPDAGISDAVNKGFASARGEIIGWLNADDVYCARDTVETVVRTFAKRPQASIVYGDCAYMSRAGRVFRIVPAMARVSPRGLRHHSIPQSAVFFRRRVAQTHALRQDLHYLLDYEYWLRLCRTETFVYVPKILSAYRVYPESKSFERARRAEEESEQVLREYFGLRGDRTGLWRAVRNRSIALGLRLRGFGRLPEVYEDGLAFPGGKPPRPWLGIQQLVLPIGVFSRLRRAA